MGQQTPPNVELNPIPELLEALYSGLIELTDGEMATYIPELSHADPSWFGLALATLDGHVYAAGDADLPFTLQSVSKPFAYALALADRGLEEMLAKVGVEPSGEAFNAIRLEPGTGRPPNPMVNAGAIVVASMVDGATGEERLERLRSGLSTFAGRELTVNRKVYESELATGDRNRALAYLMRNAGSLTGDVEEQLGVYFGQCSIEVTARDLAVMSVTLANSGVNPLTGAQAVDRDTASQVLTMMATCGMYDFAGEWLLRVGLPAKGGVSGGIAAALPAQFGIGVFSPPLDARGNSVRGIAACEELSARFELHLMRPPVRVASALYLSTTGGQLPSSVQRAEREQQVLDSAGDAIAIRGLQGDIGFASAEALVRELTQDLGGAKWLILDLSRVNRLYPVAVRLLKVTAERLAQAGVGTVRVDADNFATLDDALLWCEERLLADAEDA